MRVKKEEKLADYISGLKELKNPTVYPIGAIVIGETDREGVLEKIKDQGITVLETENTHPDIILRALIEIIKNRGSAVFNITKPLSLPILTQLRNLTFGQVNVLLPGEEKRTIVSQLPGGFLLLLMNNDFYKEAELGEIPSSFCNLTA